MNNLPSLVMIALAALGQATLVKGTDWEKEGLIGRVRRVEIDIAVISDERSGAVREGRTPFRTLLFDGAGNKTEDIKYSKGVIVFRTVLSYDSDKVTNESQFNHRGDLVLRTVRTLNSKGQKIAETSYESSNSVVGKWIYSYDASDRLFRKAFINRFGEEVGRTVISYDMKGWRTEVSEGYVQLGSVNKQVSVFDDNGRLSSLESYSRDGPLLERANNLYDGKGNLLEQNHFDARGNLVARSVFSYDENNNPIGELYYRDAGVLKQRVDRNYELDSMGNWVKSVTSRVRPESKEPRSQNVVVLFRRITYY